MVKPLVPKVNGIIYGGDYNPEQWTQKTWREDFRLMREAGVNLVSLGIFSWSWLQPQEHTKNYEWLDEIMDLLHKNEIYADLATASASPPPWFSKLYPKSLPVTASGVTLSTGSRQQYCPSNPDYRKAVVHLVTGLAERYARHPALAMWHIGNEYGCHVPECYCDISAEEFRLWLKNKYGKLQILNQAWGTAFWSQRIGEWSEINPPRLAPATVNPMQQLDFKEFSSDELIKCYSIERAILKEFSPKIPVTTNFMNFFKNADYWKWSQLEDVVSNDNYQDPADPNAIWQSAMACDLMRSLARGKPWLLMEQTSGQVNWRPVNVLKRPGQMRALSYQAISRGADGIMFFQWRASQAGSEKFHSAMVPHVGTKNSRIWNEVSALGQELGKLDSIMSSQTVSEVAILFDWRNWWALELDSKPSALVQMMPQLESFYQILYEANVVPVFVNPKSDLVPYKVVIVPNLYMADEEIAARLESFVNHGGTLVMSFFSGIVDEQDQIRMGGYPAPFRRLLGLRVEEFDPYPKDHKNSISTAAGDSYDCHLWSDVIDLEGAKSIAEYTSDFYAGKPAVTCNDLGEGKSYYLGTRPDHTYMKMLLTDILSSRGIAQPNVPAGVEVSSRLTENTRYTFVINQTTAKVEVPIKAAATDLLSGKRIDKLNLEPFGVSILTSDAKSSPF